MSSVSIRLAGVMSIFAFTVCLLIGTFSAGNPFGTTVSRALAAMGGTFVVGLIVGTMANRMIEESVDPEKEKPAKPAAEDR